MQHRSRARAQRKPVARLALLFVLATLCLVIPQSRPQPAQAAQSTCSAPVALVNGDFESPSIAANSMVLVPQASFPGWKTTAPDLLFELWHEVRQGFSAGSGTQFVELNANYVSTLYQDLPTTPGQRLRWQLQHRGRLGPGPDVMDVQIGPPGGTLVSQGQQSDGNAAWGTHAGTYVVPSGQTTTRFAFVSVSAAQNKPTYGNFLDGISFGTAACLTTATTVSATNANVGDILTYTVTTRNDGGNPAQLTTLSDDIPAGLTFVPGSIKSISGTTSTAVSDAADTDTGEYDASTRTVSVRAGVGATSSAGGTIPVGESRSFSYQAKVTSAVANTTVTDTSTSAYTEPLAGTTLTSTSDTASTTVNPAADLAVTAVVAAPGVVAGSTATTVATVVNNGPNTATNLQITAVVPAGITGVAATSPQGTCTVSGSNAECDVGSLASAASATMTITGSVPASAPAGTQATLTAAVTSSTYELNQADNATSVSAAVSTLADLKVVQTYNPSTPIAGASITYRATVTNAGPSPALAVMLTDPIATGSTFVSATPASGSCSVSSTNTVECSLGDLQPGASTTVDIVMQLDSAGSGAVNNAVSVTSSTPEANVADNNYSVQSAGTAEADMGVHLTIGSTTAYPGDTVPFTLTVTNNGPSAATNVSFNTVVPAGFTVVRPASPNCTAVACTFASIPAHYSFPINGTVQVGATAAAGVGTASTTVISPTTDTNPANDTDSVSFTILLKADLSVTQTLSNPSDPSGLVAGQNVQGVVTVTNNGPTRSEGVVLRQAIPAGGPIPIATATNGGTCTFQGTGSPGGTTPDGGTYVCGLNVLNASASWQITFAGVLLPPGWAAATYSRTATVSATSPDPDSTDDSVTTSMPVAHRADLAVAVTTGTPSVVQSETVTFHVTLTDNGPSDATNAVIRSEPPSGIVLSSGTPSTGSFDSTGLTWSVPRLSPSSTATLDLTGSAQDAGTLTTWARVLSADSTDSVSSNDAASVTVNSAAAAPALGLTDNATVSSGHSSAGAGDTISYSYQVTNTGNLPMTQLVVTGTVGHSATCATTTLAPGDVTTCTAGGYTVTSADVVNGTPITDTVTASAENSASNGPVAYATAQATVPLVAAQPSLVVVVAPTVSAAARQNAAAVGDRIDYQYTVINNGNVQMDAIAVSDALGGGVSCPATSLAVGATMSCTSVSGYTVRQSDIDSGGPVSDAVTVTAAGGHSYGPFSGPVTVAAPAPALTIAVTAFATTPVAVGDTVAYSYVVANTGNIKIQNLAVSDSKVLNVTCPATTLAVGASVTCASAQPYAITQGDVDAGVPVADDAVVAGQGTAPGSPVTTAEASSAVPVVPAAPALSLTLTPSPAAGVRLGDQVTANYSVRNTGNVTMTALSVTGAAACASSTLAPAATTTCTSGSPRVVTQSDVDAGAPLVLTAQALARAPADATPRPYDSATASVSVAGGTASLTIAVTAHVSPSAHANAAEAGDTITYSYLITNPGSLTMQGIAVSDALTGTATCPATSLAPAASTTCTSPAYTVTQADADAADADADAASVGRADPESSGGDRAAAGRAGWAGADRVGAEQAGVITDSAYVSGNAPGAATTRYGPASAEVAVAVGAPALRVLPSAVVAPAAHQDSAALGDQITYTYRVDNAGDRTMTAIAVHDDRVGPADCPATTLAVHAGMTCTARHASTVSQDDVDTGGSIVDKVYASAARGSYGPFPVAVTLAAPQPQLRIAVSLSVTPAAHRTAVTLGDTLRYAYTVGNIGTVTMSSVSVRDSLAGTGTCDPARVSPGATTACTGGAAYQVGKSDVAAGKPVTDTAYAWGTAPGAAGALSYGPARVSVPVTAPKPAVAAAQTATWTDTDGDGVLGVNDDVVSTVKVTNTGNVMLVRVHVTGLPAGVTCPATALPPGATLICVSGVYHLTAAEVAAGQRTYEAHVTGDIDAAGTSPVKAIAPSTVVAVHHHASSLPARPHPGQVALTGRPVAPIGLVGLGLLAAGGALILLSRRFEHGNRATARAHRSLTGPALRFPKLRPHRSRHAAPRSERRTPVDLSRYAL